MAAARLRTEWLQRWWCKKYNRPSKDPLLAEYTLEELMIEHLQDLIELDPQEEFPREVRESGRYAYRTGDKISDEWARKAAAGEKVDVLADLDEDTRKMVEAAMAASKRPTPETEPEADVVEPEEFSDEYGGG